MKIAFLFIAFIDAIVSLKELENSVSPISNVGPT
jgi:hypothetical protein